MEEQRKKYADNLNREKVATLKEMCKEKKLSTSGKKAVLIARLVAVYEPPDSDTVVNDNIVTDDLDELSLVDLQDAAKGRNIDYTGSREEVLWRLRDDIQMAKQLNEIKKPVCRDDFVELSLLLEKMAEEYVPTIPKHVNVIITSLGLEPEKFTVGGAPSVTADVLRKLAGDPSADPPKYGTVCMQHKYNFADSTCADARALTLSFPLYRPTKSLERRDARHCIVYVRSGVLTL
jgi:hypothetical protein